MLVGFFPGAVGHEGCEKSADMWTSPSLIDPTTATGIKEKHQRSAAKGESMPKPIQPNIFCLRAQFCVHVYIYIYLF